MVEMEVHRVQVSSRAYHRVVLRAKQVESSLHIVIGPSEASAIALGHREQDPPRPLSYDMAVGLLREAGAKIHHVAITDLQDGIYYAEIHVTGADGDERVVDSRPSDAIALALRWHAPIFAAEAVLEEDEAEWDEEDDTEGGDLLEPTEPVEGGVSMEELLADAREELTEVQMLEKRLRQAVAEEAYEEAARLRDRLATLTD